MKYFFERLVFVFKLNVDIWYFCLEHRNNAFDRYWMSPLRSKTFDILFKFLKSYDYYKQLNAKALNQTMKAIGLRINSGIVGLKPNECEIPIINDFINDFKKIIKITNSLLNVKQSSRPVKLASGEIYSVFFFKDATVESPLMIVKDKVSNNTSNNNLQITNNNIQITNNTIEITNNLSQESKEENDSDSEMTDNLASKDIQSKIEFVSFVF